MNIIAIALLIAAIISCTLGTYDLARTDFRQDRNLWPLPGWALGVVKTADLLWTLLGPTLAIWVLVA